MRNYIRAALAGLLLSAIPLGAASAGQCYFAPSGGTQCYETTILVDPTTGLPYAAGGSGSSGGSVTAPGTNGTNAQAVQGITGGVPIAITGTISATSAATYNSTPPTLTSGSSGPLQSDVNGNLKTVLQGSLPAFAATPTFNVGTIGAIATAANQATEIAAQGTPADTAYAGSGSASIIAALKGVYNAVLAPLAAGSNIIGKVGIDQTTPGTTNKVTLGSDTVTTTGTTLVAGQNVAGGAGGIAALVRVPSAAASTNAAVIRTNASRLYKVTGYNAATTIRWLHFYNSAANPPVPGTTAVFFALPLPPGQSFSFDAQDFGYYFSTGIGFSLTVNAADSDTTPLAAGDILNLNIWVF